LNDALNFKVSTIFDKHKARVRQLFANRARPESAFQFPGPMGNPCNRTNVGDTC
jgi:hypothetical protein